MTNSTANPTFTGLNKHLIAQFFPLKRMGDVADANYWQRDPDATKPGDLEAVFAPLTQAGLELSMNWQSPFENAGVDGKFSDIAQMAQAGMFSGLLKAIGDRAPDAKPTTDELKGIAEQLVGRSGVTKINSTQVFSGMPPVKLQVTAFFRAFYDPKKEVEDPIRRLQQWSLPQQLAKDGVAAELIKTGEILSLMPSLVPLCIGFTYKGRTFKPMVIESISDPLDAPIDKDGRRISATVQMTLCTLTALDKADWQGTYTNL